MKIIISKHVPRAQPKFVTKTVLSETVSRNKKSFGDSQTEFPLLPEKLFTSLHHKGTESGFKQLPQYDARNDFSNILVYLQSIALTLLILNFPCHIKIQVLHLYGLCSSVEYKSRYTISSL